MSAKEPGIYFMDRSEYERLPRVNWSTLKLIDISPAHYRQALLEPFKDTDPLKLGRACHLAVFEPELFRARCVVWEDGARRGKAWEAFVDRHPDDEILTVHQYETALAVGAAVRASSQTQRYISGGKGEVTVLWKYSGDGFTVDCKSRLDFVAEVGALVDLKTVSRMGGASPRAFGFTCDNLKYVTQAAFYRRAYESVTGKRLPYFLIAAETMPPHAVQVYSLKESQLEEGEKHFEQLLEVYRGCRDRSSWPAYSSEVLPLELPAAWGDDDGGLVEELGIAPAIGFGDLT